MRNKRKLLIAASSMLIFCFIIGLNLTVYTEEEKKAETPAQEEPAVTEVASKSQEEPQEKNRSFLDIINSKAYAAGPPKDDKKELRERWKELLGLDVFIPYFKAKEAEDWIKEKVSIRFRGFKGKPHFKDDQIKYIFKIKF